MIGSCYSAAQKWGHVGILLYAFWLGRYGNWLAWESGRRWTSLEQFLATQRRWMFWGIIVTILSIVLSIVFAMVFFICWAAWTDMLPAGNLTSRSSNHE